MKLFSYDKKTGRFEYRLTDRLSELDIRTLLYVSQHGCLTDEGQAVLFAEDAPGRDRQEREDNVFQIAHDVIWHLRNLSLVEWEKDKIIADWDAKKKEYVNHRKLSGYFLTEFGKAFVSSLDQTKKRK